MIGFDWLFLIKIFSVHFILNPIKLSELYFSYVLMLLKTSEVSHLWKIYTDSMCINNFQNEHIKKGWNLHIELSK